MLAGAASGALAATGIGAVGIGIGNAAISMTVNASEQLADMSENPNKKFDLKSMALDGAIGGILGSVGGKGFGNTALDKLGTQTIKRPFNALIHKGFSAAASELRKSVKYYGSQSATILKREMKDYVLSSTRDSLIVGGGKRSWKHIKAKYL